MNQFKILIPIIFTIAVSSCSTTKYQELGFGGGNSSFATKKAESQKVVSEKKSVNNTTSATLNAVDENILPTFEEHTGNPTIKGTEAKKVTRIEKIATKIIENRYSVVAKIFPRINHRIQTQLRETKSTLKSEEQSKKSKWPNSESSFWKWLLTIIACATLIFGIIVMLAGVGDTMFGEILFFIGLSFLTIGYLILLWARNIN